MISEAVRRQIAGGEGERTEFASSLSAYRSMSRAVCAFLNGGGGTVLCGVDDGGRLVGVGDDADRVRQDLESRLNADVSPSAPFTVTIEREGEVALVAVEVPAGRDTPYVLSGAVYLRSGSRTRAADSDELRSMIQRRAAEPERWERRPALGLELEDLDPAEIRALVGEATESGRFRFRDPQDDRGVLRALGMVGEMGLTQGADVAFGRDPVRRHPQARVRVIKFTTDKAGDAYETDTWIEGPVVTVFDRCVASVAANVRLQSRFRAGDVRRENQPEYALYALREGIVNALAHRDYASFSGGVVVSIYPDRIEIWNSGRLPKELSPSDLRRNHPSIPTNPDIVHVLYLRNLMERVGRGTQAIIRECRLRGARPPRWQDRPSGVTLTLYASPPRGERSVALNARQEALLGALREGERLAPLVYWKDYAADVSDRQARRDLAELEEHRLLVREARGASTTYLRTDEPWPTPERA